MKQSHILLPLALASFLVGTAGVVGAFVVEGESQLRVVAALAIGLLLVVAAALLAIKRRSALPFLWLSAAIYIASILFPAFQKHGEQAFGVLMGAFYWSASLRLSLAALAQAAFSPLTARLWRS